MKIRFIHTADLHLGCKFNKASFPGHIAKKRREEMWTTFFEIIGLAKKEKTHFLLISGDLFEDNRISLGDLKRINEGFCQIPNTNIIISPGNHDPYGEKTPYKNIEWSDNVFIFTDKEIKKIEFEELKTRIYGFAWRERYIQTEFRFELEELDSRYNNILIAHGDIFSKNSNYLPMDRNYLTQLGFDYIALGHIHKPHVVGENIRYCGSPEPLDFGETGQRGIIVGEFDSERVKVDFLAICKREFTTRQITIDSHMNYNDIVNSFRAFDHKDRHLFRVQLLGYVDSDIDMEELLSQVKEEFFYMEIVNKAYPDYDLEKLQLENEDNIIAYFIREMTKKGLEDQEVKNALYYGLHALLEERTELCT